MIVTNLRGTHTHAHRHSLYTHWAYLVSKMKININTKFIYIVFFHIFFYQVNDKSIMPHRHNIFSNIERKTEDYKKHINNFTACAICCCFIYFSFVPFSFLYYWLKTKASSHTHPFGVWYMGLRPTQVESFANISAVSLFGHNSRAPPSHFISSLMMSYQTRRLESLPLSAPTLY